MTVISGVDRSVLGQRLEVELERFVESNPRSKELYERAQKSLVGGVPMPWMMRWAGGFPVFARLAIGARIIDVDDHTYVDFCLGDTGAMTGHDPQPVVSAITDQERRGITTMLPTENAAWVGEELQRRFGLDRWMFTLTATDANRWAIRLVRAITGRPKILVNSYCYHGSVDESLIVVGDDGEGTSRPGNVGSPVDVTMTSRVAEFNDIEGLEKQLAHGDVAAVLMEPALTNIGIVLPEINESYLKLARQIGCSDIVTTLKGEAGKQPVGGYRELVVQRQRLEEAGLHWTVVESQQPPDVIKLGLPGRDEAIDLCASPCATSVPPESRLCVTTGCRCSPGYAPRSPRACGATPWRPATSTRSWRTRL